MSSQPNTLHVPEWTMGDRLRKAREVAGYSQAELALAAGISRQTISNAELDDRHPHPLTLKAWSAATGVALSWLLDSDGPPSPKLPRVDSNHKPPGLRYLPKGVLTLERRVA